MLTKKNLAVLTGAGVRIGIIDSGYSPGSRQINVIGGTNLLETEARHEDYTDCIGHGTACAGIVAKIAPEAEIYPVKIFDRELVSDVNRLCDGIFWCIEHGMQIIHLSLGTTESGAMEKLAEICETAHRNGIVVVAAASNDGKESYPASLPHVFGVAAGKVRDKYGYHFDRNRSVQFIARGDRQRLDWIDNRQVFMGGTSFAAPHITGLLALILQQYPDIDEDDLMHILEMHSLPEAPLPVDGQEVYDFLVSEPASPQRPRIKLSDIHGQNDIGWIQKAVVYPFNKEMHSLVRFHDLLSFQIAHVVDVVGKRTIGKDCGDVLGTDKMGFIVQKDLETCLVDADTLILGYLDQISRIRRKDVLDESLQLALKHQKHVYSLTPITRDTYPDLKVAFDKAGLRLESPVVDFQMYQRIVDAFDHREKSQKPVIGVFGTSPQQGKFTAQLMLRRTLQKQGYRVGQLGTEHQSALFGFDFTFPNGYDGHRNVLIPMNMHIPLLQSVMVGIEREDPHIILVGGQSGLIPYSYAEKSPVYTLPSLITLMGTLPDAYVLVANSIDEYDFIQDTIQVLKAIGKGETILLVFSNKKKQQANLLGHSHVIQKTLTASEILEISNHLESRFNIPATEIISEEGQKKAVSVIIDYFAKSKV